MSFTFRSIDSDHRRHVDCRHMVGELLSANLNNRLSRSFATNESALRLNKFGICVQRPLQPVEGVKQFKASYSDQRTFNCEVQLLSPDFDARESCNEYVLQFLFAVPLGDLADESRCAVSDLFDGADEQRHLFKMITPSLPVFQKHAAKYGPCDTNKCASKSGSVARRKSWKPSFQKLMDQNHSKARHASNASFNPRAERLHSGRFLHSQVLCNAQ